MTGPGGYRGVVVLAALALGAGSAVAQPEGSAPAEDIPPEPDPIDEAETEEETEADTETEAAPEGDEDLSELSLEELLAVEIVTASNMRESLSRAPGVVIRLSREDLIARGYREILDVFDDLPGMDVIRPWGDNYLKVYWRGYRTDVNHPFLMMVDGMVVNSLWTGDGSAIAALPISEVDHIEIVYGPASAVYGANAFMGVVNVITTAGIADDETRFRLDITTGSYHFQRLDQRIIDGLVVHEERGIRLTVAGRVALNWTDAEAGERFEYSRAAYANDPALWGDYLEFENLARGTRSPLNQYGLDARLRAGELEVGVMALSFATGYGVVYPTDAAQPYAQWVQYERSAHVDYHAELTEKVTSRSLFRLRESGIDNSSYFLSGYNSVIDPQPLARITELSYWQARNRSASFQEDVEAKVGDELAVLAGARYERKELQGAYDINVGPYLRPDQVDADTVVLPQPPSDDLESVERPLTDDYGVYAQARYRKDGLLSPCDAHALHVGIRYDWNSVFGDEHSPTVRVGYVGEFDGKHGLFLGKLLYGEGFHEPNPRQLYGGWLGSGSDPSLRPESSRTLEVNGSHTTDRISNLISAYYVGNYDTITQFAGGATNKGKRTVLGIDYHLRALLRPPGFDSLSLWAYYSFIWSEELTFDADDEEVRAPIGDLAAHKVWLGATAQLRGRYSATLRSRGVAARETVATNPIDEIPGYLLFDTNLAVDRVAGWPMRVSLRVDNILGTAYSHPGIRTADSGETPGTWDGLVWNGSAGFYNSRLPQPGRSIMLTVGLDL